MSLHYELEVLDELITGNLHPRTLQTISDQQFENWNGILLHEKEGIKKRLKKVTYSIAKENQRRLYVQQHQHAIARLKNLLIDFLMPMDGTGLAEMPDDVNLARLYKRCLHVLDELMQFLRDEFRMYFNDDEKIPVSRLLMIQQNLKPRLASIKKYLLKNEHDSNLVELILDTISVYCYNETCNALTYRIYSYLKFVMGSLEKVNPDEIRASHYPALPALLVYINFNATSFKNYMVKLMHAEINAGASIEDKIETISFHHKEISQLPVKTGMALSPALPSVQLDLVTWLFTEMTHLEKKQTLGIVAPIQFKEPNDPDAEKGIYSLLTVEELALFLKAMKETGVVKNRNMKQVCRRIAEDWHSKQKENISWQYLYNSMSTVEAGTVKSLDSKLMDMVNWLRKMKGELR